jgi:subtilisin family serine protease
VPAATPATTALSSLAKSAAKLGKSATGSLLQQRPDVSTADTTVSSKLTEVVSKLAEPLAGTLAKTAATSDSAMSRLGGPQDPNSSEKEPSLAKAIKKDDGSGQDTGALKQAGRGLGRRVPVGSLMPPPGTFKPNEVLAINLSADGLKTAVKRDFKVIDKVEFLALGFTVTRLETPHVQNALIGRTTLHEVLPEDGFGLNHIYRAEPAKGQAVPSGAVPGPSVTVTRPGAGCAPDRCFGVSVINWQPQLGACARGVKIGVIDTGVDKSHPAFAGVQFEHRDFIPRNAKKPLSQHGTGILSLLAGSPRSSTPGLVPDATFLVGDAFFVDRNGSAVSDTLTMLKALNWLKASGVDIANLSFAGPPDELVHDAIRELARTGTVILAAAGNEGQDAPPSYPAAYNEVIAVTAVDRNLAPYVYANRGNHIDVAAPGVDVWTALPNRREGPQTGTSFAVPFVTSVVALGYRSDERSATRDPLEPKQQALAFLHKNIKAIGGRGRTPVFGAGLVQAPSHCEPRSSGAVASAGPKAGDWSGSVQVAPRAQQVNQPGSWASTVHPTAGRK